MKKKYKDISINLYHRIYRLAVRKIPSDQIAVTLNLPIYIVKNVVANFKIRAQGNKSPKPEKIVIETPSFSDEKSYLDIYLLHRLRFLIVDLNGMIVEHCNSILQFELNKLLKSDIKAIALLMVNVKSIDEVGLDTILSFHKSFINKGRYTAILDPSIEIESFIIKNELEKNMDIFGTEKAFEDTALKTIKQK